ncbi:TetR/AcrR family transcriptional regulator [Amnibacterium sp.]|uniref:TetR/AcrR family transcriptional regulator n=1 Tax=Amnibacterium sp. TaxID=1872496 RepID=UPI003F7BAF6C
MPAPARTGREQIVEAASMLLDEGGADAVTMQAVADRVGVRSPSLYKHVRHRSDLLAAVVHAAVDEVTDGLAAVRVDGDARASIVAQVDAMRRFARARPHAYALVMGAAPGQPRPTPEAMRASLRFLLAATGELAGEAHALDAARLVVAWANGFITMELADALQMGGDIDEAWRWGLARIVAAIGG